MHELKVVAINSFAVHGMASLKATIHLLGNRVLPVPTVLLNGLTNMPYVKKQAIDFNELLESTFRLIAHNNQTVLLYIGYIGNSSQVDVILQVLKSYRKYISHIVTDPISGDHGKTYVPIDVISRLAELVIISDYAFPNLTELKLLTGHVADSDLLMNDYVNDFRRMFPTTKLVVTSFSSTEGDTGVLMSAGENLFRYEHKLLSRSFGGTGDAFLIFFIKYHFYDLNPVERALQMAAEMIYARIKISIEQGSAELML